MKPIRQLFPVGPRTMLFALACGYLVGLLRWGEPSGAATALAVATAMEIVLAIWLGAVVASPLFEFLHGRSKRLVAKCNELGLPARSGSPRLPLRLQVLKYVLMGPFFLALISAAIGPLALIGGLSALIIHLGTGIHSTFVTLLVSGVGAFAYLAGGLVVWGYFLWMEEALRRIKEGKRRPSSSRLIVRTASRRVEKTSAHVLAMAAA